MTASEPMTSAWYPVYGHPRFGTMASMGRPDPWYLERADGIVMAGRGNPTEPPDQPCFEIREGLVYPFGRPEAWFERVGTLLYTAPGHPAPAPGPWYQCEALLGLRGWRRGIT